MEINKAKELADIEAKKFKELVGAIGKETIVSMAKAGPETKAKLLKGLGLKGFLVSDGKNPINLFNTANGNKSFLSFLLIFFRYVRIPEKLTTKILSISECLYKLTY